jgi:hypothetical protein
MLNRRNHRIRTPDRTATMQRGIRPLLLGGAALCLMLGLMSGRAGAQPRGEDWIGTWAASPQPVWGPDFPVALNMPRNLRNQTLRQIVHVSIGGNRVRVVLSNEYGDRPMRIGAAHTALAGEASEIEQGSDRPLTFGGQTAVTIPPGAPMVSDPVDLTVPAEGLYLRARRPCIRSGD